MNADNYGVDKDDLKDGINVNNENEAMDAFNDRTNKDDVK